jgi:hypothetical protein
VLNLKFKDSNEVRQIFRILLYKVIDKARILPTMSYDDAGGFSSDYYFSPEKNIGVVFLLSSGGNFFAQLANDFFFELVNAIK